MDKDQAKGKAKVAVGSTREKAGEMTGNRKMESQGAAQKTEGKAQGAVGKVKEAAHDMKAKVTKH
jgi:uncharacterized protein YjbJ (UPF0337 family)